jgi:hypothetical protein
MLVGGECGSVVGGGAILQAGRSRFQFPIRPAVFFFFVIFLILPASLCPWCRPASNRYEYHKIFLVGKARQARKTYNLSVICEPTVYKMWYLQHFPYTSSLFLISANMQKKKKYILRSTLLCYSELWRRIVCLLVSSISENIKYPSSRQKYLESGCNISPHRTNGNYTHHTKRLISRQHRTAYEYNHNRHYKKKHNSVLAMCSYIAVIQYSTNACAS